MPNSAVEVRSEVVPFMTEERLALQEMARDFAMREVLAIANELDPVAGEIPLELRRKMADLGFFGRRRPATPCRYTAEAAGASTDHTLARRSLRSRRCSRSARRCRCGTLQGLRPKQRSGGEHGLQDVASTICHVGEQPRSLVQR